MEILDDGAEQRPSITEQEERVFRGVRATVRRICSDEGLAEARVIFVDVVGGSTLNAQFRTPGGTPTVYVAQGAACELTPAARCWLLAHEIGHYRDDTRWRPILLILKASIALLCILLVAGVVLRNMHPSVVTEALSFLPLWLAMLLSLWFQGRSRVNEARADAFAVLREGSMTGAQECIRAWAVDKPQQLPAHPATRNLKLLAQSHPGRHQRLASMTTALERAET